MVSPAQEHVAYMKETYKDIYVRQPTEGGAYVLLGQNNSAGLFDEIKAFREAHPTVDMSGAFAKFRTCGHPTWTTSPSPGRHAVEKRGGGALR